ncbi:MAG: hypothetical protein M1817_006843 [Caeruleum heppii]|nr:MAG: hypothetical protein M1817_006843 [Caeruleum heppii]
MRASAALMQHFCRITLFTRANCSLCDNAKQVLSRVRQKQPFDLDEVDVMGHDQERWRDLYEYDTPVVHVHDAEQGRANPADAPKALKLMHRFSEEDVQRLIERMQLPSKPAK